MFRGGLGRILANELRFGIEHHYNASDPGALAAPSVAAIWDHLQTEVFNFFFSKIFFMKVRLKPSHITKAFKLFFVNNGIFFKNVDRNEF